MVQIRPLQQSDFDAWATLWRGYLEFYETVLEAQVYNTTFARMIDPSTRHQNAFVAEADLSLIHI